MLRMNSVRKKRTDKTVVKEHIVLAAAKAFAKANGLEKPFISFYKMTAYWQPFEEGDAV